MLTKLEAHVSSRIIYPIWHQVRGRFFDQIGVQVQDHVEFGLGDRVWDQVRNPVWVQVWLQINQDIKC